jgi:toluene monooxygenase system protein E
MERKKTLRTWSDFGNLGRVPSEYEVVTHNLLYSTRPGRAAALEESPASPMNVWIDTYRDRSRLCADDWNAFRDPHQLTYRKYVALQDESEAAVGRVLDEYSEVGHDRTFSADWVDVLARAFTPLRYPFHALQMCAAYIGQIAPTSYVTNAAAFEAADALRAVSLIAYRTRELQTTHPSAGFATGERAIWEADDSWQPVRRVLEKALITYEWGESFAAVNLAFRPAFDEIVFHQFAELARANGDELTWLLLATLRADSERCLDWSIELAKFARKQRSSNTSVLREWLDVWAPLADAAAGGFARILAQAPGSSENGILDSAVAARELVAEKIFA